MKETIVLILIAFFFIAKPIKIIAQVNIQDSLALVEFYDSTGGKNWFNVQWQLTTPVKQWQGVRVEKNRVTGIELRGAFQAGTIPLSFGNLTALKSLYLLDCRINSTLPASFGNLTNLTFLKLSAVFYNSYPFPTCLTKLTNLTSLDLSTNHFSDSDPISMENLTELRSLDLSYSYIGGQIPLGLENLKKLNTLILNSSDLSGTIPVSISDLDSLSYVDLSENHLSGSISIGVNNLSKMSVFKLADNNYTFQNIEPFVKKYVDNNKNYDFEYSPQSNILINQHHEKLGVSPGGTLASNTFKWYKAGVGLVATITGDSTYAPENGGEYYVDVTNSVASHLTLTSRSAFYSIRLEDATTTVLQNITGTETAYINDGVFKIADLKPIEGTNALNGDVTTTITIEPTVLTFNSLPYVQRHFDITPSTNDKNAQAIVTLYFTYQDFVNYNNYVTTNNLNLPLLPTEGIDNGNVRIIQFHGTFTGSSKPENYSGSAILITPTVIWDSFNSWWVVSFPVSGFSGFYLSSTNSVLPLALLNFDGKKEINSIGLQWKTDNEINIKQFIVQRRINEVFSDIGTVPAQSGKGINNYAFNDGNPDAGNNFYRLKMDDVDGLFTFSDVITINFSGNRISLKLYPNPATFFLTLKIISGKAESVKLIITDASGKSLYQKIFSVNTGDNFITIDIERLPVGMYYLNTNQNGKLDKIGFIKE